MQGLAGPGTMDRGGLLLGPITSGSIIGGYLVARAGTLTAYRVKVTTAPSGINQTFELRKNGVAQSTATILVAATDSGEVTVSVTVAAGDRIEIVSTSSASAAAAYWSVKGSPS
jgi:hypothetical protein